MLGRAKAFLTDISPKWGKKAFSPATPEPEPGYDSDADCIIDPGYVTDTPQRRATFLGFTSPHRNRRSVVNSPSELVSKEFLVFATSIEGKIHTNEDRYIVKETLIEDYRETLPSIEEQNDSLACLFSSCSVFAVIDGHGGCGCAEFIQRNLVRLIVNSTSIRSQFLPVPEMLAGVLEEVLGALELQFLEVANRENDMSGACIAVALIYKDWICIANVGDCFAACYDHRKNPKLLSKLHRSVVSEERRRIESAGGCVVNGRAMGQTIPSRTIGDLDTKRGCKGAVIAKPFINKFQIKGTSKSLPLLLLATDGFWDGVDIIQVFKETRKQIKTHQKQRIEIEPLKRISELAQLETKDDCTVILVKPPVPVLEHKESKLSISHGYLTS